MVGPGDWLECIDARPCPDGSAAPLVVGDRYEIAEVYDYLPYNGTDGSWMDCAVDLVGIPSPGADLAWGLYRFRPLGGHSKALETKTAKPVTVPA